MSSTFDPNAAAGPDSGVYGLPHTPDQAKVVVVPVPFEATCSYGGGTVNGPAALLRASRQVDLFDVETGRPYEDGISMLPEPSDVRAWSDEGRQLAQPIIAAGGAKPGDKNLERVNSLCAWMNAWVYATCANRLAEGKLVATVGGDHSCAFGAIRAHAEKLPGLGVLHLDAHADLRQAYEGFTWSHASIMFNVVQQLPGVAKLVQVGIRDVGEAEAELIDTRDDRIHTFYDADVVQQRMDGTPWNRLVDKMVEKLPQNVYLSFDIDGLDPTLCPHTGTPVPGGLSFHEAVSLVAGVVRSGRKIVGLDLMELAPGPEGDEWDGNVGARLLYKMIGYALKSRRA